MKKVLPLLAFLLLSLNEANAQNNLPPVYEIKSDTAVYLAIDDSSWQMLEDKSGKLTIKEVRQLSASEKFHANNSNLKGVDYRVHYYWFRYRLKNAMAKEALICLTNSTNADQSDFYVSDETAKWSHFVTGILYPNDKKDGLKKINSIPISIGQGKELVIYNRIKNYYYFNKPDHLSVTVGFTSPIIQENYIGTESNFSARDASAIFAGILLFACVFSLFFYSIVRDKVYMYYSLFLFYFASPGEFLTDFIFPGQPYILLFIVYFIKTLGIFLFVQFIRHFLKTSQKFPDWDKALKAIAIAHPLFDSAAFFIEPHLQGKWNGSIVMFAYFLFVVGLFMILITFLKYIRIPGQSVAILKIAAIPAAIFWSFGIGLSFLFDLLGSRFGVEPPEFMTWLNAWFDVFNMLCVLWFVVSFSWVLLLQFVQLRKENIQQALDKERFAKEKEMERSQLIEQKKIELEKTVEERTAALKQSLFELQSAQSQLIQAEKMASLGELTAGIAHEIQNPLNFVNNFSEVSNELIDEMKDELTKGNNEDAIAIAEDVKQNLEKILHHGKRADAIVKGMLQHSRSSRAVKEPTDINKLADEYLRLAYHGLRAKDKSFNANLTTDFDESIGDINIIPQDIGRAILNLITNAFYAVGEKKKQVGDSYEPSVFVSTKKIGDKVLISVKDNGNGIPQKVADKIFQPFFTTKPTGQGTGLGLSLSYDIVKAHSGEIKVMSEQNEGAEFIIQIPFKAGEN